MLDITKSKITLIENISGSRSYRLDTPGHEPRIFRRIIGGAGWPARGMPGYLAAVGEDQDLDFEFDARHMHRIFETGEWHGAPLMTWDSMFEAMHSLSANFGIAPWFCLPCPSPEALVAYNRSSARSRRGGLRLRHLPDPDFQRFVSTIYKRTTRNKTLHFGPSEIASRLSGLDRDISTEKFDEHPHVTAMAMAVNALEYTSPPVPGARERSRIADRVGGY